MIENPWFDRLIILVIGFNSILLAFYDYRLDYDDNKNGEKPLGNILVDESEIFFTVFFLAEFLIKIIGTGLVFQENCYFRCGWNWLDFCVVVTAVIQYFPNVKSITAIRMFRFLRPLRTVSIYPSMKILANTLFDSLLQLINIVILYSLFIYIFSIIALQMWAGAFHYRCRETPRPVNGDWPVVKEDFRTCGSYHQCDEGAYCGSLYETYLPDLENVGQMKQYILSPELQNNLERDNLIPQFNYGITSFDNILKSFITIFQCTTLEGWFQIMVMIQNSENIYLASFFFIILIIICSYFLLNLTVAVMLDNFKQLNKDKTFGYTQKYENNRIRVQNLRNLHCQREISPKKNHHYFEQFTKFLKRNCFRKISDPRTNQQQDNTKINDESPQEISNKYDYRICRIAWNIVRQPIFNHLIMILILLNSLVLASDSYPQNEIQQTFQFSNKYFSIGIIVEQFLKIIGLTWQKYIKDKFNLIDLIIIIASITELIFSDEIQVIRIIRTFRLIRLIKLVRSNNNIKMLLNSIAKTLIAIGNFIILLSLFIYIFSLLGMSQFSGSQFDQDSQNDINIFYFNIRTNFDTIEKSLITVFQVLIGEHWNLTMYKAYLNVGPVSYIYFFLIAVLGKTILLNLFLSILLGNFELSSLITRSQEEDLKLRNIEKRIFARYQKLQEENHIENASSSEFFSDSFDHSENQNEKTQNQEKQLVDQNRAEEIAKINKSIIQKRREESKRQSLFLPELEGFFHSNTQEIQVKQQKDIELEINSGQFVKEPKTAGLIDFSKRQQTMKLSKNKNEFQQFNKNNENQNKNVQDQNKKLAVKRVGFMDQSEISQSSKTNIEWQNDSKGIKINQFKDLEIGKINIMKEKPSFANLQIQTNLKNKNQVVPLYGKNEFDFLNTSVNSSLNLQEIIKNKRMLEETQLENTKKFNQQQTLEINQEEFITERNQQINSQRKLLKQYEPKFNEENQLQINLEIKKDYSQQTEKRSTESLNKNTIDLDEELIDNPDQLANNQQEKLKSQIEKSEIEQPQETFLQKITSYLKQSSLFILHKDTKLRQFLLKITTKQMINSKQNNDQKQEQKDENVQNDDQSEDDFEKLFWQEDEEIQDTRIFFGEAIHIKQIKQTPSQSSQIDEVTNLITDPVLLKKITIDIQHFENEFENVIISQGKLSDLIEIQNRVLAKVTNLKILYSRGEIDTNTFNQLSKKQEEAQQKTQEIYDIYYKRLILKEKLTSNKRCEDLFPCGTWSLNIWFENFIQLTIFCSLMILVNDVPNADPDRQYVTDLKIADRCVSIIFFTEAIFRIGALGFFYTSLQNQKAYFMDSQNRIDFFVCVCCDLPFQIIQLFFMDSDFGSYNAVFRSLKVLRSLRALRILRVISKSESLRIVVGSLFEALPSIINGLIICSLFIFMFAIIGVSLFKGSFFYCQFDNNTFSFDEINDYLSKIDSDNDCVAYGGHWVNKRHNFDNVLNALSLLFQIITTEGWLEYMYAGIDSRGPGLQPKKNYNLASSVYFILFMLIGNIFLFKLFAGIVIEKFARLKDKSNGLTLMTRDQRDWLEQEKSMLKLVLKPVQRVTEDYFQQKASSLLNTEFFKHFLTCTIITNFLIMSFVHYQQSDNWNDAIWKVQIVLVAIYNLEAFVKITAKKQYYFQNIAYKFDFFILVFANIIMVLKSVMKEKTLITQILNITMCFPLLRIFRIIHVFYQYKVLIGSLRIIFPAVANVGCLILLIIFMFAIIGMNMFPNVIYQDYVNENNNFEYFGLSILLLIRCTTGENWNFIMDELAIDNTIAIQRFRSNGTVYFEYCQNSQSFQDVQKDGPKLCGNKFSYIYFGCFIIIIQMMMLNLFIAVVLEGFSSTNKDFTSAVTNEDYKNFLEKWLDYDPDATGWLKIDDLVFFLNDLPLPFNKVIKIQETEDQLKINTDPSSKKKMRLIDKKDRFLLHNEKNFIITHKAAMLCLDQIKLPVYRSDQPGIFKVHFCSVIKRLTHLVMKANKPDFDATKMSIKHFIQIQKKWEETYPDLVKDLAEFNYDTGRIFSALFILMCARTILQKKKMLIQGDAYNLIQKERKLLEERENAYRKAKIQQQLKKERAQKKAEVEKKKAESETQKEKRLESAEQGFQKYKINKTFNAKKQKKTDNTVILEKRTKKRQEEEERDKIDADFITDLKDKILLIEKKKKHHKMDKYTRDLVVQQFRENLKQKLDKKVEIQLKNMANQEEMLKWNDPKYKKDFERSTWFLKNEQKSLKMKTWVQNFHVQERYKMLQKNFTSPKRLSQIKEIDKLLFLEKSPSLIPEQKEQEIFEVGIDDNLQDFDPKHFKKKRKQNSQSGDQVNIFHRRSATISVNKLEISQIEDEKNIPLIKPEIINNVSFEENKKQEFIIKDEELKQIQGEGEQSKESFGDQIKIKLDIKNNDEEELKEIIESFQTGIVKEYPQGEIVSSIDLSEDSVLDKSIMSSSDQINQVRANLNYNN